MRANREQNNLIFASCKNDPVAAIGILQNSSRPFTSRELVGAKLWQKGIANKKVNIVFNFLLLRIIQFRKILLVDTTEMN